MSMIFMVQAMRLKVGNAARKLVLLKLADNANDQGKCWPSYGHIAEACEMDKRTVMRHIQKLSDDGLVSVAQRMGQNGNSSNMYTLNFGGVKMPPLDESAANDPSDNLSPPSDLGSPALVIVDHPPSDRVSPRICHRTSQLEPISPKAPFEDKKTEDEILDFLNDSRKMLFEKLGLTHRNFRHVEANLKPIRAVLKAQYTPDQIRLVIEHLIVRWGNDSEFRSYIEPQAIFRKTKFETKLIWAQSWEDEGKPGSKIPDLKETKKVSQVNEISNRIRLAESQVSSLKADIQKRKAMNTSSAMLATQSFKDEIASLEQFIEEQRTIKQKLVGEQS